MMTTFDDPTADLPASAPTVPAWTFDPVTRRSAIEPARPQRISAAGEKPPPRATQRYKIFQPGLWRRDGSPIRLHLLDISLGGARAYSVSPPALGGCVFIECGAPLGLARVSWVDGKTFGVRFLVPLALETIDKVAGTHLRLRDRLQSLPPIR